MSILRPLLLSIITLFSVSAAQAATYFFHTDHLGTPQVLSDKDQNVVWQGEYSPFGDVTETTRAVEQNLRFPGQYFDVETGLYYNYFRDYSVELGRYIQSDPIGLSGGLNLYSYASNDPVEYIDEFGLSRGSRAPGRGRRGGGWPGNGHPLGFPTLRPDRPGPPPPASWPIPNSPISPRPSHDTNRIINYWNNLPNNSPREDKTGPPDWRDVWAPPLPPGCRVVCNNSGSNVCTAESNGAPKCHVVCIDK